MAADFDALFEAAKVPPTYVLIGQSGGGNIVAYYGFAHPKNVAGLVLIDSGFDNPDELAKEFPGAQAWAGQEHIDCVDAARVEWTMRQPIGDFPVLVINTDHNEVSPPPPSAWLKLSPKAREIVKHCGHDLHKEIPDETAAEIRSFLVAILTAVSDCRSRPLRRRAADRRCPRPRDLHARADSAGAVRHLVLGLRTSAAIIASLPSTQGPRAIQHRSPRRCDSALGPLHARPRPLGSRATAGRHPGQPS